jgi:hypothetical protein
MYGRRVTTVNVVGFVLLLVVVQKEPSDKGSDECCIEYGDCNANGDARCVGLEWPRICLDDPAVQHNLAGLTFVFRVVPVTELAHARRLVSRANIERGGMRRTREARAGSFVLDILADRAQCARWRPFD